MMRRNTVLYIIILLMIPVLLFCLYHWSVSSFFEDMAKRTWFDTISHPVPHSDEILEIREYAGFRFSGAEFYLIANDGTTSYLGKVDTNEYTPFQRGQYRLEWLSSGVTIYYQFCNSCTIDSKESTFIWEAPSKAINR